MKVIYIAGPYRGKTIHETLENIRKAEKVAIKYWQMGHAVICPHKNTALLDGTCKEETWLTGYIEIMKRCDTVVLVPGWKESEGSIAEYMVAVHEDKEIIEEI